MQWLVVAAPAGAVVTERQGGDSSSYGNAGLRTADVGPAGARLLEAAEADANRGSKLLGSRLWWLRRGEGRRNDVNADGPSPSPFIKPVGSRKASCS